MNQTKRFPRCFLTRYCLFVLALLSMLFLASCGNAEEAAPGQSFLTAFYTSNQDGRYDAFQVSMEEGAPAADSYRASFSQLCTENGYTSLMVNRIPVRYDQYASQYGCQFVPREVTVSSMDKDGNAAFTVLLTVTSGEKELGTVTQTGDLTLEKQDNLYLVDSLWLNDMDTLQSFLEEHFTADRDRQADG